MKTIKDWIKIGIGPSFAQLLIEKREKFFKIRDPEELIWDVLSVMGIMLDEQAEAIEELQKLNI